MTNYARKTRGFFVFVFVYCLVTVGKSWHGNIAISQVKLRINVEFSELGSSSSRMWWFNFLDVVQLFRCHLALINGFSYTFIHSEKVKEQVCFVFFFLSSSTIRSRSTGACNSNTKPMSRHFYRLVLAAKSWNSLPDNYYTFFRFQLFPSTDVHSHFCWEQMSEF